MFNWIQRIKGRPSKSQPKPKGEIPASSAINENVAAEVTPLRLTQIPKEWLMDKIPHEDIVSGAIYQKTFSSSVRHLDGTPAKENKNPRYWMIPYSATDGEDWIRLQRNIQPEDEIWTFSSTATGKSSPWHRAGVCLVRNEEVIDAVIEEAHFLYRK